MYVYTHIYVYIYIYRYVYTYIYMYKHDINIHWDHIGIYTMLKPDTIHHQWQDHIAWTACNQMYLKHVPPAATSSGGRDPQLSDENQGPAETTEYVRRVVHDVTDYKLRFLYVICIYIITVYVYTYIYIYIILSSLYLDPREGNKFHGFWEFLGLARKFLKEPEIWFSRV